MPGKRCYGAVKNKNKNNNKNNKNNNNNNKNKNNNINLNININTNNNIDLQLLKLSRGDSTNHHHREKEEMEEPFLQPHPDLQSAVGNAPLSSKHPTHLPTTDCLLSITPLMGGQPSDAPALSPPSPLQQGGQSSNAPALSPPSPLPQGSQPIALVLSPSSPLPQDGQPSDAPGLSPSSSTLLLCPSDSTLSICHLNSQSAVKTGGEDDADGGMCHWYGRVCRSHGVDGSLGELLMMVTGMIQYLAGRAADDGLWDGPEPR
ncbi:hypothetical protein ACOMHN_023322 [Nucella lapillus]